MDPRKPHPQLGRTRRHAALHAEGDNDDMFYSCADCGCSYCLSDLDGEAEDGRAARRSTAADNRRIGLPRR